MFIYEDKDFFKSWLLNLRNAHESFGVKNAFVKSHTGDRHSSGLNFLSRRFINYAQRKKKEIYIYLKM